MDDARREIAALRARAAPPDPMVEIAALRARLARIEAAALAATTPTEGAPVNLEQAVGGHYSPTEPPPTPEQKQLEAAAYRWQPDAASEDALRQRAKDPAAYDRAMEAMHVSALPLSLYSRGREAAVKLGTFVPDKEGTSNE
jgi:hypothetical protein